MKKQDKIVFLCLLLVAVLLCLAVNTGLEAKEEARIYRAFTTAPERQPGTVWCTDIGDVIYVNQSDRRSHDAEQVLVYQNDTLTKCELVMIGSGYYSLQPVDQPEQALLTGKYYMDDKATLRLEPSNPDAPILQGRSRLILKRYYIADNDCPFFHVRIN